MKIGLTTRAQRFLASLVALTLTVTSCGLVRDQGEGLGGGRVSDVEELLGFEEYVPALEFDSSRVHMQPGAGSSVSTVDIHGPAFVHAGERGLSAHDVLDDHRLWSVSTEHGSPEPRSAMVLEHGETVMAVGSFRSVAPGTGTTRDTSMQEVLAVDLLSGEVLWHDVTEAGESYGATVVGLDGDALILSAQGTRVVDVRDGSPLWLEEGVTPRLVEDGVVVASSEDSDSDLYDVHRLHGLDVETGDRVWEAWEEGEHETHSHAAREEYSTFLDTDPEPGEMVMAHGSLNGYELHRLGSAGPGRFYVTASYSGVPWDRDARGGTIALFDTATGVADYSVNHDPSTAGVHPHFAHWGEASCTSDQEEKLVCWVVENGFVTLATIDSEAGEALWAEEFSHNSERRFIEPVSAWKGVLYARVEGEPIILDLEDGSDLVIGPETAPILTNGTIAVEFEEGTDLARAYPVTG